MVLLTDGHKRAQREAETNRNELADGALGRLMDFSRGHCCREFARDVVARRSVVSDREFARDVARRSGVSDREFARDRDVARRSGVSHVET